MVKTKKTQALFTQYWITYVSDSYSYGIGVVLPGGGGALCINLDRDAPPRIFSVYPKKITAFRFQPPKITEFLVPETDVILVLQFRDE